MGRGVGKQRKREKKGMGGGREMEVREGSVRVRVEWGMEGSKPAGRAWKWG